MNWLAAVFQYLPAVLQGVVTVESVLHGAPGATKKAIVIGAILAGAKTGQQIPEPHVQAIGLLIDQMVATLNASGIFGPGGAFGTPLVPPVTPVAIKIEPPA